MSDDLLSKARRRRRNGVVADAIAADFRDGEDPEAEARRYGLRRDAVRRRVQARQTNIEETEKLLAMIRAEIPPNVPARDWPTAETLSSKLGLPIEVVRRGLNVVAWPLLRPEASKEWKASRDSFEVFLEGTVASEAWRGWALARDRVPREG